ncbi:LysR substrate-binding domain-containing protein [Variovorax sp.]|jgi:LysR family glycine cleavage system transcriptional activator|uniref:LysR substrate-binding domain-containing protein n=1 Tax=Variovorax sp. TaxID=1871043 RepID=UPI0037D9B4E7
MTNMMGGTQRISLPPLKAVRVFEAAARHLNYRVAAEELYVTAGAVGQQIRSLESQLGCKLFVRKNGSLTLTASGRAYAQVARQALLQLSKATAALTSSKRTITIWAPPSLAARWLLPRLVVFDKEKGDIELRICADIAEPDLTRMDVDLVIEHSDKPRCKKSLKLFDEELFPVCSPALLERLPKPFHPRALLSQSLLHTSLHDFWPAWLETAGVRHDGELRGSFFNQATLALETAVAGRGFALACDALVEKDICEGRLIQPFTQRLKTGWSYRLTTPKDGIPMAKLEALRIRLLSV